MNMRAVLRPTKHGKHRIAVANYEKGRAFLQAYHFLKINGSNQFVVLHNLLQGLELTLKACLLFHDYDHYKPKIPYKPFAHDVAKCAEELLRVHKRKPLPKSAMKELKDLSDWFKSHHLRYGGIQDVLIDPSTIPYQRTFSLLVFLLKWGQGQCGKYDVPTDSA